MATGRTYLVGDIPAQLISMSWRNQYAHMIEGGPSISRKFRLLQFEGELARAKGGLHIHQLAKLREDIRAGSQEWLPSELVRAELRSEWVPKVEASEEALSLGYTLLEVVWFQNEDADPFAQLKEIVSSLDWKSIAIYDPPVD